MFSTLGKRFEAFIVKGLKQVVFWFHYSDFIFYLIGYFLLMMADLQWKWSSSCFRHSASMFAPFSLPAPCKEPDFTNKLPLFPRGTAASATNKKAAAAAELMTLRVSAAVCTDSLFTDEDGELYQLLGKPDLQHHNIL